MFSTLADAPPRRQVFTFIYIMPSPLLLLLAGALVLPSGQVLMSNARILQVVNPYTGDASAQAPPLPEPVKDMTWE